MALVFMATDIAFAIEFYLFWESSSYFAQSILTALAVMTWCYFSYCNFYTETIAFINLFIAFAIMGGLFILNRRNVHSLFPYLIGALPCGISC
jgi:NhaA family Na+:H+ antiporter